MYQTTLPNIKAPQITDKWAGLRNSPRGVEHSRFSLPATRDVCLCCRLLAANSNCSSLACSASSPNAGTSASPGHAVEGKTHAASALEIKYLVARLDRNTLAYICET